MKKELTFEIVNYFVGTGISSIIPQTYKSRIH